MTTDPQVTSAPDVVAEANSIFEQPWWLNTVAPGAWGEAIVKRGDQIAARFPYAIRKRYRLTVIGNPQLTQSLGPWLRPSTAKYCNQLGEQKDLMEELIAQLPYYDLFRQALSYRITNWLPFYWKGFSATTQYTYRLEDLGNLDAVWSAFRENVRGPIRKAQKSLQIRTDLDVQRLLGLNRMTFERQGLSQPYDDDLLVRVDEACRRRGAGKMFFAIDDEQRIHAGLYLVWDAASAYYLVGAADPSLRNSGAQSLLLWEAIRFAATVTKSFDFEGSMLEPVERSFRAFGAHQTPYFRITKMSRRMGFARAARDLFGTVTKR